MAERGALIADRYRLLEQLGAGGMGVVWKARDERLDRLVAIKQLRSQPGLPPEETAVAGERAMREARITARLHHPHAVAVFDVVEDGGSPCIVMELVPSVPLTETLRSRVVIAPTEAARIGTQIAGALAAAHALGIVHRDVKPGNVLIGVDNAARICDFGISRAYGDTTLTMTGMITGTPAYLAPEVARGEDSTFASDVYSLGATLYAAVEGRPPSGTEGTPIAVLYRVAAGQVQRPERAGALASVLLQMLAADPADRPSMAAVAGQLASLSTPGGDAAEQRTVITAGPRSEPTRVLPVQPVGPPAPRTPQAPETSGTAAATVQRPASPTPVGTPEPDRPRRRARPVLIVAALAVLAGIAVALAVMGLPTGNAPTADAPATSNSATQPADPDSEAPTTRSAETSAPSAPTSAPTSAPSSAPTSAPSSAPTSGDVDQAQLVQAVTGYYALLPDDTDAAWNQLTASYQRQAGGRDGYEDFWNDIDTVTVSDARASGPGRVEATVSYVAKSSNERSSERRFFNLVAADGVLKINQSDVL